MATNNSNEQMSAKSFREMLNLPPAGPTEKVTKIPKKQNKAKEKIALERLIYKYAEAWKLTVIPEYRFHPVRMWRFDWFIPELKVGIEFQGLDLGHSKYEKTGHQTAVGRTNDCEKANQAQILGLTILQYTALNNHYEQFATDIFIIVQKLSK